MFFSFSGNAQFLGLTSEIHATSEFGTTYRIYAEFGSATDECVAVYSVGTLENNPVTLELGVTTSFYQWQEEGLFNGGSPNLASEIWDILPEYFPDITHDSWFTIGSETSQDETITAIGMSGAFTEFNNGNGFILGEGAVGGSWYITPGSNPLAHAGDDGMVLLGQFTAADDTGGNPGHVTCNWNIQWRDAVGYSQFVVGATHSTSDIPGCTESDACNYNLSATTDDGSCLYTDALGECGGPCEADIDADGICDDVDDCVGLLDTCGVCNGPGQIYDCGCTDIPDGDCDCEGGQPETGYDCNGDCLSDFNDNGICDIIELIELNDAISSGALCGEGTVWNDSFGLCLPLDLCPSDIDEDGLTGVTDLMELLAAFGAACETSNDANSMEWTCGDPINYHDYDYATVQIGGQCWFAENLRNEHYANGDLIPGELNDGEWSSTTNGAQAIYANDASNLTDYGRLYNWYAVDDARELCPSDWHVPTDGEFMTLEMELGMSESEANDTGWRGTDQGTQMKSSASDSPSWDGTNTSGFSGLAGGYRNSNGAFLSEGDIGYFWSASADGANAWYRKLGGGGGGTGVNRNNGIHRSGLSVRCVRD